MFCMGSPDCARVTLHTVKASLLFLPAYVYSYFLRNKGSVTET